MRYSSDTPISSVKSNLMGLAHYSSTSLTPNFIHRNGPLNLAVTLFGNLKDWLYIGPAMRTLIIHPQDPSTDFLSPIYAPIRTKTVVKGGITKSGLHRLIETHDRVIMLGHGAPYGLMNARQFPDAGLFIVDGSMTDSLRNRSSCIFIWCHANEFLKGHGLSGLCSGMFISEMGEAEMYGFNNIEQGLIDKSNDMFSSILSKYIDEPMDALYQSLLKEYEVVARNNPIAKFNLERLQLVSEDINYNLLNRLNAEYSKRDIAGDNENGVS